MGGASAEERAEDAQERFRVALERGDRTEAIAAIEDLRATVLEGGRLV